MRKLTTEFKGTEVNKEKPLLVVLSGPSGTGKSTILSELLKRNKKFIESVSATTRTKRRGEREGRDYFFLTQAEFRNKMKRGEFIETATVFKELYGTPKKLVVDTLAKGKSLIFDIDVQGGMSIKRWKKDAVLVFILPPSMASLRRRLVGRKTESEANLRLRLDRALKEIKFLSKYDYVVCNSDISETVGLILQIIRAESQRVSRTAINF